MSLFFEQAIIGPYTELSRLHVNDFCKGLEPWQIIAYTFGFTLILTWLWDFLFQPEESKLIIYFIKKK